MYFYLIGVDYKSSTIDTREKLYRNRKAISGFCASHLPHEAALLTTCNRIEIYGLTKYADDALGHIAAFSERLPEFSKYAYVKYGEAEVFHHALRLGVGLESQLKGEPQILAQLEAWSSGDRVPLPIKVLWDRAITLARKIRVASKLNEDNDNIATIVLEDIRRRLGGRRKYEIVIVGTGKIAELFSESRPIGAHLLFAAHKNYQKAQMLAMNSGGDALFLKDLPGIIARTDALICATSSPHHVIEKDIFNNLAVGREYPLYIYDLAIPRDVEPASGRVNGIFLNNLDSLRYLFYRYNKSRQERIELASDLIGDVLKIHQELAHGKDH